MIWDILKWAAITAAGTAVIATITYTICEVLDEKSLKAQIKQRHKEAFKAAILAAKEKSVDVGIFIKDGTQIATDHIECDGVKGLHVGQEIYF